MYSYYVAWLIGAGLLVADALDLLRLRPGRLRLWRAVGGAVGAFIAAAPLAAQVSGNLGAPPGINGFALAYLITGLTYFAGVVAGDRPQAAWVRRAGYVGLLALGLLPSWVYVGLNPAIALAGIGLARPRRSSAVTRR